MDDPTGPEPVPDPAAIRALLAAGDSLAAFDAAEDALGAGPDGSTRDMEVGYLLVLALARSGSTELAEQRYAELGLDSAAEGTHLPPPLNEDVPALHARLAKDRAWAATGESRSRHARTAAERYAAVFDATGGHFSAVNAATMFRVAGDTDRSAAFARRALDAAARAGAGSYWRHASAAEAHLLLEDIQEASRALHAAATSPDDAPARRATTHRQLRRVCEITGADPEVLAPVSNPAVLHVCGHRLRAGSDDEEFVRRGIEEALDGLERSHGGVGSAWGSLAAGGDILCAEALLERGVDSNVVLACSVDDFIAASVRPAGDAWVPRFERCLDHASSVVMATDDAFLGHDTLFEYAGHRAMGEAVLEADRLDAPVAQLAVWDGSGADQRVGTGADVATWRSTGRTTHVVDPGDARVRGPSTFPAVGPDRVVRAMLFGDIKGFSRLSEPDLPVFFERVMGAVAGVLDDSASVLYRNSWGDGLYVVLDSAVGAARAALAMQDAVDSIDADALGLPADLGLRLGGHAGPVFAGHDPVRDEPTFFGAQVTRTARIEPRTPEGEVFVTDAFAALVRLEAPDDFTCEYVGHIATAKDYGAFPMYRLVARY
ncbi:MAG: adenylate/guanylate cyclase domain-containing protein [Acidimicrobiia bacterium]